MFGCLDRARKLGYVCKLSRSILFTLSACPRFSGGAQKENIFLFLGAGMMLMFLSAQDGAEMLPDL